MVSIFYSTIFNATSVVLTLKSRKVFNLLIQNYVLMFIEEDAVSVLNKLGLSNLEARTYIVLCGYGTLSAKEISRLTDTAQADIYRVVSRLHKKGLVEKIIEKPIRFKSVPFEVGSSFLLERKKSEINVLHGDVNQINLKIKEFFPENSKKVKEHQFLMIPKRENIVKKIAEAIERSKIKIDLYLTWNRFYKGMTSIFAESARKAWNRGVQFRIIVEYPKETAAQKKAIEFCEKTPLCNIRFTTDHPKTVMGIYDENEVFIIVDPTENLFNSPALWSNNQSLLAALQEYFELLWLNSREQHMEYTKIKNA